MNRISAYDLYKKNPCPEGLLVFLTLFPKGSMEVTYENILKVFSHLDFEPHISWVFYAMGEPAYREFSRARRDFYEYNKHTYLPDDYHKLDRLFIKKAALLAAGLAPKLLHEL
jgi:hypothetical protein